MSTSLNILIGTIVGFALCALAVRFLIHRETGISDGDVVKILEGQFSSEHLSSEELALVIERGYRAKLWYQVEEFLRGSPDYTETLKVLGPPDAINSRINNLGSEEKITYHIVYKVGRFDLPKAIPSNEFYVIQVYFHGEKFATWSGAGLSPGNPLATSSDSREHR